MFGNGVGRSSSGGSDSNFITAVATADHSCGFKVRFSEFDGTVLKQSKGLLQIPLENSSEDPDIFNGIRISKASSETLLEGILTTMEENTIPNIFKTCDIKEDHTIESFSEIFDEGDYFKDNILENPGDQETMDSLEKAHFHRDQLEPVTKNGAENLEKEPAIGEESAYITTAILNRMLNEQDLYEDEGSVSAQCNDKGILTDKVLSQLLKLREGISSTLIDQDGHAIHARDDFMNMKTERLIEAVDVIREELGSGLVACDIFDQSGLSYSKHNSRSAATVLFADMTAKLRKILKDSEFPPLSRYYMLVLEGNQIVVIALVGDLQMGMLVDGNQVNLGLLLNVIVEKALKVMKAPE